MSTTTLPQPAYGPHGEPYALQFRGSDGPLAVRWFWTEAAAWAARDFAIDLGFVMVRVLGAPCRGYAVMPSRPFCGLRTNAMDKIFSHIVTTHDILTRLRESIQLPPDSRWSAGFDLVGIRVEACPTKAEAMARVFELRQRGHKPQLLMA